MVVFRFEQARFRQRFHSSQNEGIGYSRVWNRRRAGNKRRDWKIGQNK